MAELRNIEAKAQTTAPTSQTTGFAATTARGVLVDVSRRLDPEILDRLYAAALDSGRGVCARVVEHALANGTHREELTDFYIPEAARKMGAQWCADELGFVEVTIGASRLQAVLRDLVAVWSGDSGAESDAPSILLIVPAGAHHTLGAMVLSGQLRRKGYSVGILLGPQPDEIRNRIQQTAFQSVFISASQSENLETLRRIVNLVHAAAAKPPPVVIGGSILEIVASRELAARTGANYATNNPDEALKLCGLKPKERETISLMDGC